MGITPQNWISTKYLKSGVLVDCVRSDSPRYYVIDNNCVSPKSGGQYKADGEDIWNFLEEINGKD